MPQITLNGNLKTWLAFFSFLGAVIAASVVAGQWIAGVNVRSESVDSLAVEVGHLSTHISRLTNAVERDRIHRDTIVSELATVRDNVEDLKFDVANIRTLTTKLATRAWVFGLSVANDKDKEKLRKENEDLRIRVDKLENTLEAERRKRR